MKEKDTGRPRNPEVEARALQAAIELYGDCGWNGFTLTDVVRQAKIGKSSLYSRWDSKGSILLCAFRRFVQGCTPEGDTIEEILSREAAHRFRQFVGPYGKPAHRLLTEAGSLQDTELFTVYEATFLKPNEILKQRLWQFKENGQIGADVSISRLLDSLQGAIFMRSIFVAASQKTCFIEGLDEYIANVIHDHLRSIYYTNEASARSIMARTLLVS